MGFQYLVFSFFVLASVPLVSAASVYEVGPNRSLENLAEVPWELLEAGDEVLIHWRAEPYREKFVIGRRGLPESPIVVRGIPNDDGARPVIDGRDATTRTVLNYWNEDRGVVKIGGSNVPSDTTPAHIVIESLEIRSGREPYSFSGRSGVTPYRKNAASVFIEKGEEIVLRDLVLHDSGNGLFVASASSNIRVIGCRIFDNGVRESIYEHNAYTQARGIVYQHNYFGPLREGCLGSNLKDRSAGVVVRYNWIEGGNRQLDLVDGAVYAGEQDYASTYVYGNILIERDGDGNRQIVHYGGDSADTSGYRKGSLHFFSNTIVSWRTDRTTLLRLSTNDETAHVRNNLVWTVAGGTTLSLLDNAGRLFAGHNWLGEGWRVSFGDFGGAIIDEGTNIHGENPGFVDSLAGDFRLDEGSACLGAAGALHESVFDEHLVIRQWAAPGEYWPRHDGGESDIGAFESGAGDDEEPSDPEEPANGDLDDLNGEDSMGSGGCDCRSVGTRRADLAILLLFVIIALSGRRHRRSCSSATAIVGGSHEHPMHRGSVIYSL